MRRTFLLVFAWLMLISGNTSSGDAKPAAGKRFHIKVRVCEGDPLGNEEAKTLKILAEPLLVAGEDQAFAFLSGGEVAFPDTRKKIQLVETGLKIQGKVGAVTNGKIQVDLTFAIITRIGGDTENRIQRHTESTRTVGAVKLGEVIKLGLRKGKADSRVWAEVSVKEAQ